LTEGLQKTATSGHSPRTAFRHFARDKKTPDEFYFEALPAIPLA
jgi:hypothetical protein